MAQALIAYTEVLNLYNQGKRFIDLFNTGKGEIRWSATSSQPWVQLNLASGTFTTEQRLWVSIDWPRVPTGDDLKATIYVDISTGSQFGTAPKRIIVPVFKPAAPARDAVTGYVESHGYGRMEAEHFTRSNRRSGAAWEIVKGLGRSGDSVTVLPAHVASVTEPTEIAQKSPSLEYSLHLFSSGKAQLTFDCLPTKAMHPKQGGPSCPELCAPQRDLPRSAGVVSSLRQRRNNLSRRFRRSTQMGSDLWLEHFTLMCGLAQKDIFFVIG